jgi:hypothetical protein
VVARDARLFEALGEALSGAEVAQRLAHVVRGQVQRYAMPGIAAYNFVATRALGGGGASSLQLDRQAKTFAVQLLCTDVMLPARLLDAVRLSTPPRAAL